MFGASELAALDVVEALRCDSLSLAAVVFPWRFRSRDLAEPGSHTSDPDVSAVREAEPGAAVSLVQVRCLLSASPPVLRQDRVFGRRGVREERVGVVRVAGGRLHARYSST